MQPTVIARPDHSISRKLIDPDALKVMYRLLKADYRAFLVGGGVRDLLLGRTPKDFDIGTDAHPHQIKKLFRNCRLVGRRFRLAHVHFGDNIIEVSTFRRRSEFEESASDDRMIRSDNTFGDPEEDSLRRDFTINGLFYDLETFSVLDYVGGIEDLDQRLIRSIGDPNERIPEDPVRIIRAIKFAARLGFDIEPSLWDAMVRFAPDIHKCPKPRVLEEVYRLLRGGTALDAYQLLDEVGLLRELLPEVDDFLTEHRGDAQEQGFWNYLAALDELEGDRRDLSNSILLGVMSVHLLDLALSQELADESQVPLARRIDDLTWEWVSRLGVARRDRERLAHMLRAQPRFRRARGRRFRPRSFVAKHYYPDAETLFALGSQATGTEVDTLERWRDLHDEVLGNGTVQETAEPKRPRRRRRRRPRSAKPAGETTPTSSATPPAEEFGRGPRRRRRRQRSR